MSEPIVYIDKSDIREGKLAEVKTAIHELVAFVERHVPQLIAYGFYLNEDGTRMTVVAIHRDSASLEFHLETGGPAFRNMAELITLRAIEVYGRPSDKALSQLHQKAGFLGEDVHVLVHEQQDGFSRIASAR